MSSSSQFVPSTPDVLVRNEGTVFLFCPLTSRGKQWIEEHVQPDALREERTTKRVALYARVSTVNHGELLTKVCSCPPLL